MIRQPHTSPREIIIADAIKEVVSELRLVDVVDYIAFIRLEQFGCISDIVDSAAELFFYPGALRLGHGGEVHVAGPRRRGLCLISNCARPVPPSISH